MPDPTLPARVDVAVIGAGHNGLVAAARLARRGLSVAVLEAADVIGGACRTEYPFADCPQVASSTGAYLLGLMPPELLAGLDVRLPLRRRDPHYLLPARSGRRALVLGADPDANAQALTDVFSAADASAAAALGRELAVLRDDLAPSWLLPAVPVEETAERWVRPALQLAYLKLVRGSAVDYLRRFGFASEELVAMYAATDGMPGSALAPDEPGTGHNLLVHSMCRLPGADGTWLAVDGGMGAVTEALVAAARTAGATVWTVTPVVAITHTSGSADGVELAGGRHLGARAIVAATDPYRLANLGPLPGLAARLDAWQALPGMTMKLNLALSRPPDFGVRLAGPGATVHLLPDPIGGSWVEGLRAAYDTARAGELPDQPAIEVYVSAGLATGVFVQGVPHEVRDGGWETTRDDYVAHLLDVLEVAAPGLRASLRGMLALAPPDIERRFGITGGHIFHVDNSLSTVDRVPCRTELPGLYAGAAGCHPAGSVIGAAGWIAAGAALSDLGR